jgi:hypothetical protein
MTPRPVNKIAAEIDTIFRDMKQRVNPLPFWVTACRPYVAAMLDMTSFKGWYGIDEGSDIGKRFLVNAQQWRGEAARRIKDEIRQALKESENVQR